MSEIVGLIERLEKATAPDREIDAAIMQLEIDRGAGFHIPMSAESLAMAGNYTSSIDQALTLIPEGWKFQVSDRALYPHAGRGYVHNGELHMSGKYQGAEATAATPAIALCIAALKARYLTSPVGREGG